MYPLRYSEERLEVSEKYECYRCSLPPGAYGRCVKYKVALSAIPFRYSLEREQWMMRELISKGM